MALLGLSIKKLFGHFDYDFSLANPEGITILTGPNGYGKTTALHIVYNLFKTNFYFFRKLNFERIELYLEDSTKIILSKKITMQDIQTVQSINGQRRIVIQKQSFIDIEMFLQMNNTINGKFIFDSTAENRLFQELSKLYPMLRRVSSEILLNSNTGFQMKTDDLFAQIPQKILEIISNYYKSEQYMRLFNFLLSTNVYLIKEQRLLKPTNIINIAPPFVNGNQPYVHTIQDYAVELRNLIGQRQAAAFQESQKLDNSFPSRLMKTEKRLPFEEFTARFQALTDKQKKLQEFGITISNTEVPQFNEGKADVLSVYLDDSEKKTTFFDALVAEIDLFVTILKNKQLTNKSIVINANRGFYVETNDGKALDLSLLSSGEQQEIVLLYELLFKTEQNTLILIDEPEISLHVTWQKEFVNDLLKISKQKNISFCLATHSPQIINGRWDLVTDLYTLANKEANPDFEEKYAG
jgi:predicted ATP-binding protein involved in virulence